MLKPGDFFVGVVDFFSVLLPGALLTAMLALTRPVIEFDPIRNVIAAGPGAQWVAFVLASYALGHFLFLIASKLDDLLYDRYRKAHWPPEKDHCFREATKLREAGLPPAPDGGKDYPMNTFKWAKTMLMLHAPAALADVNRYEADSKFFRSMVVVLAIVAVLAFYHQYWLAGVIALVLTRLSFSRYAERRHKSTEWAYQYAILLHEQPPPAVRQP